MDYLKNLLIAVDQLVNALIGGWADETLSSRAHRTNPFLERLIDGILFFDPDHCKKSFQSERLRLQSPPEER